MLQENELRNCNYWYENKVNDLAHLANVMKAEGTNYVTVSELEKFIERHDSRMPMEVYSFPNETNVEVLSQEMVSELLKKGQEVR